MCGRSASFNLAVLLAACGLLTADGVDDYVADATDSPSSLKNDPSCSSLFRVVLGPKNSTDGATSQYFESNGSFFHDGVKYPPEFRWTEGNVTYGCICKLYNCLRKCCRNDEILRRSKNLKEPICQKRPQNDSKLTSAENGTLDLRLSMNQMSKEIKHIDKLMEHFYLIQDNFCPSQKYYDINPDDYGEDTIILQANGSFMDFYGKIFPFWNYCIDWKVTVNQIGILVCWMPEMESAEKSNEEIYMTHHHVGIIISIPFLIATFLVYAITPELKNLYGKTLMCYVICLIIAYIFLILVSYIQIALIPVLCYITGKRPPYAFANYNIQHSQLSRGCIYSWSRKHDTILVELKNNYVRTECYYFIMEHRRNLITALREKE